MLCNEFGLAAEGCFPLSYLFRGLFRQKVRQAKNDLRWESMNHKLLVLAPRINHLTIAVLLAISTVGCGAPAAPQPPSLNLPTPVLNLSAIRIGNSVHLAWTMPTRTTDHIALQHPVKVQVCRAIEKGDCANLGSLSLAAGKEGAYTDELPADLAQGPDHLLRYEVLLNNHAGKSAGPSNIAYSAAGASPPALTGLTAQVRGDGVLLGWQPVAEPGPSVSFRIERLQLDIPVTQETPKSPLAPTTPAAAQTLVVHEKDGVDPGHAIDSSALFNQRYRYALERVTTVAVSGQTVEVQGLPSETVVVATTDVFPPAIPQGLVAVADAASGAIDLSWSPDIESDLAAYRVYRRDVQGNLEAQRIASPGVETSYRDAGVQPGHTYAYSLSAVDQSGNESKRSPEVEETLPSR
jgi:hypothetical protein